MANNLVKTGEHYELRGSEGNPIMTGNEATLRELMDRLRHKTEGAMLVRVETFERIKVIDVVRSKAA